MAQLTAIRKKYQTLNRANRAEVAAKYHRRMLELGHKYNDRVFYHHYANPDKIGREQYLAMEAIIEEYYDFQQSVTLPDTQLDIAQSSYLPLQPAEAQ